MTSAKPDISLDSIRREIDAIDQELLQLVKRRFEATGRVQAAKKEDGSLAASPFRPAREAQMLRRLAEAGDARVSPQFLVRLWRVILSASTQAQAPVLLHAHAAVAGSIPYRLMLAEHFCGMEVKPHDSLAAVFSTLESRKGDLAIVETGSPWAEQFSQRAGGGVSPIASLPVFSHGGAPALLVFGHAEPQPCGDDETLLLSEGGFATGQELPPRWQVKSGRWSLASFSGFLSAGTVSAAFPGCIVAGRLPISIEVSS